MRPDERTNFLLSNNDETRPHLLAEARQHLNTCKYLTGCPLYDHRAWADYFRSIDFAQPAQLGLGAR